MEARFNVICSVQLRLPPVFSPTAPPISGILPCLAEATGTATLSGGFPLIRAQFCRIFEHIHRIVQLYPSIPGFPNPLEGNGVEDFMKTTTSGNTLIPGSLQVLKSIGDNHQAFIVVSVKATIGSNEPITIFSARHCITGENDKIKNE